MKACSAAIGSCCYAGACLAAHCMPRPCVRQACPPSCLLACWPRHLAGSADFSSLQPAAALSGGQGVPLQEQGPWGQLAYAALLAMLAKQGDQTRSGRYSVVEWQRCMPAVPAAPANGPRAATPPRGMHAASASHSLSHPACTCQRVACSPTLQHAALHGSCMAQSTVNSRVTWVRGKNGSKWTEQLRAASVFKQ